MAIRIYSLAKELQIDNKKLVDICTRAGITGKGSALASLTDEEVVKLKAYMAGSGQRAAAGGRADGAASARTAAGGAAGLGRSIRREDYIAPAGTAAGTKVPVLPAKPDKLPRVPEGPRKKPEETVPPARPAVGIPPAVGTPAAAFVAATVPGASATAAPSAVAATPPAAPSLTAPPAVSASAAPASLEPTLTEQDANAPVKSPLATGLTEPLFPPAPAEPVQPSMPQRTAMPPMSRPLERMLGKRMQESKPGEKKAGEKKPAERAAPTMHLAPMPAPSKTTAKHKPKEPAPQKPDIKLPPDAIRASKAGSRPLSEQLRKHEEKKKRDDAAAKKGTSRGGAGEAGAGAVPLLEPLGGKDRPRRAPAKPVTAEDDREGAGLATLGGREQRQLKRKRSTTAKRRGGDEEEISTGGSSRRTHIIRRTGTNTAAPRKGKVVVELPCTVRSFAEATGVPKGKILGKLLAMGIMSNITASLDADTAELLAAELGVEVDIRREVSLEQKVLETAEQADPPESLKPRPPIVTFLGHVDHGKTSLLDRIIGLDVAAHEKGGITQHIRAYKVNKDGRAVTFVDTPGHEAFTQMRARGANVTDIAVLVVAADDGVMPQTEEAISHARAAGVPIVVALNKIDLPGINIERLYSQLGENQLLPSEWGGETEVVKTSATKGTGLDELLVTLLTVAELHEYKANPDRPARGTCLEAEMHEDRGVIAKLLVQNGTLRPGDVVVCGGAYGRVKAMYDTLDPHVKYDEAGPSTPVNVTGLNVAPGAGDRFYVLADISEARTLADQRAANRAGARTGRRPRARDLGEPLRAARRDGRVADVEHHPAGRRPRLDRGHPQGARKACASRGADPHSAGQRGRHHRGRRPPGRRLRRGDYRLQCRARRKGPHFGRELRRTDPPLRHHLPGDGRFEGRHGRHAPPGEAREGTRPGPGAAVVPHQPRRHGGRLPRAWPARLPAIPASA